MSTTGRAALFFGPGQPMELTELPVPSPEPGAVVVRVTRANICGSDLHIWRGDGYLGAMARPDGRIIGHEMTGVVHALGVGVTTDWAGTALAEGDRVVMWYASASFDDTVIDDPTTFDIRREKPDHKAFGGGGRHFCLGAGLARAELRIALEEITTRMKDLQLAGDVERIPSSWANALVKLPVTFTPGARS